MDEEAKETTNMRLTSLQILLCFLCLSAVQGQRAVAAGRPLRIVVAADGSGNFKTVQQAVDHVSENNSQRVVIQIKPGIYSEQIRVAPGKRNLTFRGEDPHKTVLTYRLSALQTGNTRLAFSSFVNADGFQAENLTFENSFGTGSQAVALFVDADLVSFKNCRFLGWQDTLFVNGGRQSFKNCYIEGHVDFIFGNASAVFENCTIHSKAKGYVTAHYRTSNDEVTGFVFLNCRLTGSAKDGEVYLGRPWRPYARVVFLESWLGSHINPAGWDNWRDPAREKTAWFAEYKSKGPGANPRGRVAWSRQLTATEAKMFSGAQFLSRAVRKLSSIANQAVGTIAWNDAQNKPAEWYASAEALRIADNIILYQRDSGGWPKNIEMAKPLGDRDKTVLLKQKRDTDSTIDNGATYTELSFLARVYTAQRQKQHLESFLKGFDYLLAAQYSNGGWPQFYPNLSGYYQHITFNDGAMIGVMKVLRDVAAAEPAYTFVDEARRLGAASAVDKGIDCILKTQLVVNGRRTVWCAQYDEVALAPAAARTFELVSLSGGESVDVVRFLMSIKDPSPAVVEAIESAIAWFEQTQLKGFKWIEKRDASQPGGLDHVIVKDPEGGSIWARFYEMGSNRPIFAGRDGVVKYDVAQIEHERRNNYAWYVEEPAKLLKRDYPAWKDRLGRKE